MTQNFDQICISMVSNKFQKIFEKFSKMADFWPKNAIFRVFRVAIFDTQFSTEIEWKSTQMPQLG